MNLRCALLAGVAAVLAPQITLAAPRTAVTAVQDKPVAPPALVKLVQNINIPFNTFTLSNGLKVIVMTDRSAPIVYSAIWYQVGSTYEPKGRSGFAHLFEHLMFNGSENAPGDYFAYLRDTGALDFNGGTNFDQTIYYQMVPTGSLDRVLFLESDRMGHLLGAVTQGVLDEQRGVVQNEKRNGDNSPGSIVGYVSRSAIYPAGHPYDHSIIGSMKDLNAASLADVHQFFKDHYGPNNATLILAGDIDLATAKAKVEKYFGDIPRGKESIVPIAPLPVIATTIEKTLTGPVATASFSRQWVAPGFGDPEGYALDAAAGILGQIDGAPLTEKLVRQDKLFNAAGASSSTMRSMGSFSVGGSVRAGVDPKVAERALDATIADFIRTGVTADQLARWESSYIIPMVLRQETIETRAELLIQSEYMTGSPANYKQDLDAYLTLTPAKVNAAIRKWLTRPSFRSVLMPGPRMTPPDDVIAPPPTAAVSPVAPAPAAAVTEAKTGTRGPIPDVGESGTMTLPPIEHATLANGIQVNYIRAKNVPTTSVGINFVIGSAEAQPDKPTSIAWMFGLLNQGAAGHDDHWFKQLRERTGIFVTASAGDDGAGMYISGPTPSLDKVFETGMMVLTRPDFPTERLESRRREALASYASAPTNPGLLANEVFAQLLAPGSLAARLDEIATPAQINAVTRADIEAAYHRFVRPQYARMTVASNEPLSVLLPKLNATYGSWTVQGPVDPKPVRVQATTMASPQIVLIDIPSAVQASVRGGQLITVPYDSEDVALSIGNTALGGGFMSRINMNVREDKHWSYGATGDMLASRILARYAAFSEIQPDKVGPGIREIRKEVADIIDSRPMTQTEFNEAVMNSLRSRASFGRVGGDLMGMAEEVADHGWPDDHFQKGADRLRVLTLDQANAALRTQLDPKKWVWVVTGDAKVIRPQLDGLGLPVKVMTPAEVLARN